MPRNNKNLVAKDIDGKKIREQYFDGILIGVSVFAICYTIFSFFNVENFKSNFINIVIVVTCFSPFILLAILIGLRLERYCVYWRRINCIILMPKQE